ncbi:hypothetical protein [Campylobacter fetus]|uniref:hypothetical protein n=1 Tax=Campylobacter fetus TaxID=196 RepID=UPI00192F335D|nr:hypothetical protein [Campylobacter fetus]
MANDILKIKDIGLREVAKQTHIEAEYLEYMCDKNFDKLKKLNVPGFMKILTREYGWDLSDWYDEFKTYCFEHSGDDDCTFCVAPKIPAYTSKPGSNFWTWTLVLLFIIVGLIWVFGYTKYFDDFSFIFDDKNNSVSYSNTTVVETAKESLKMESNMTIPFVSLQDKNITDSNLPDENESLSSSSMTQNSENDQIDSLIPVLNLQQNTAEQNTPQNDLIAKIIPKKTIWIGIKSLDGTYKRSFSTKDPVDINLSLNSLVSTGHGELNLEQNDKNTTFKAKNALRFLVENGSIKQIDYDEYVKLNKGKEW